MNLPTASALHRADLCPGSAVLPRSPAETAAAETEPRARGTAVHAFLRDVSVMGFEDALARVSEDYRAQCEAIDMDRLPATGTYAAEVALAYDVDSGKGRELGRDLGRNYPATGPRELLGSADILGLEAGDDGPVCVYDVKTGRRRVPAARKNRQLQMLALAGARTYNRPRAIVGLLYLPENGDPWFDAAEFDEFDLDAIGLDLCALVDRIEQAGAQVKAGHEPVVNAGDHCRYCPAYVYCPAQTALVRQLAADPGVVASEIHALLNPTNAALAYARLKQAEALLKHLREALYAYAQENAIQLDNGLVLAPAMTKREYLDGKIAREVLARLHGIEVADAACEWSASKTSVREALRQVKGQKLAALEREALAEIAHAGGVTQKTSVTVKEISADKWARAPQVEARRG